MDVVYLNTVVILVMKAGNLECGQMAKSRNLKLPCRALTGCPSRPAMRRKGLHDTCEKQERSLFYFR